MTRRDTKPHAYAQPMSHHEVSDNGKDRALVSHHASDEPRARALVLSAEGHSSEEVGGMVGVSGRTVQRWVKRCREVSRNKETPEILDDWARIIRRAQGMMHSVLDQAEVLAEIASSDHPGPLATIARIVAGREITKGAATYNFYAGTGTDKLQKESEPDPHPQSITINFISQKNPNPPDVVEGELVDDGDGS